MRHDSYASTTFAAALLAAGLLSSPTPAAAWRASLSTGTLTSSGFEQVDLCHSGSTPPPGLYVGGWHCATPTGDTPVVSYANPNGDVSASADLERGSLKLTATANSSVYGVDLGDVLWVTVPGLQAGGRETLTFDLRIDGGFGRQPGQLIGQAGFNFSAYSGLFTHGGTDAVAGSVGWRTDPGSDRWNTTAAPDQFLDFGTSGDWMQLATNRFQAQIDVSGDDPTLGFVMHLRATGPADFGHTATVRFAVGTDTTWVSESGVFLTAVPELPTAAMLVAGLALLGCRRRA